MNIPIENFETWLKNKNLKERTIENYLYYFNKFTVYQVFTQDTVSRFLADKSHRNSIGRAFLVNFQKFLKSYYQEREAGPEVINRIMEVELPKLTGRKKARLVKPLSEEEVLLLENYLPGEKEKLQLLLTYYGGLRLGEMLKIRILNFNWAEWKKDTEAMGECRVYGKGDSEGIALIPSEIMKRTARYIRSHNFGSVNSHLFIRDDKKVNLKNVGRTFQDKLRAAGIKSGLTQKDPNGKVIKDTAVHPHRLRHSLGDLALNVKGLDLREVQDLLRHKSIQSTQIYTQINKERLKQRFSGSLLHNELSKPVKEDTASEGEETII